MKKNAVMEFVINCAEAPHFYISTLTSENHIQNPSKLKMKVLPSQRTNRVSITKTNKTMFYRQIIVVSFEKS
jgi:hypothetical protein